MWELAVPVAIGVIVVLVIGLLLAKLYRRSTRDEAYVRTGLGGQKPELGLYFNCCARGSSLYGIPGIDTAYIRQSLGDFPLIGFFGSFELGPLGGSNHLLAYTGVLALITEKLQA